MRIQFIVYAIFLIGIMFIFIFITHRTQEYFNNRQKCAVAVITRDINEQWLSFLNDFKHHNCFLFIDNVSVTISHIQQKYPNVKIMQIQNDDCEKHGFIHSSSINKMPHIIAWDRALYHMCCNEQYELTWFIEDDVFFYSEQTLTDMENRHKTCDMLLCDATKSQTRTGWNWWKALEHDVNGPPYANSLIVCSLMSRRMMDKIKEHAETHKKLYYIEALFPIIAHSNGFNVEDDNEYLGKTRVQWNTIPHTKHDFNNLNKNWIYHPVKDMNTHVEWREHVKNS